GGASLTIDRARVSAGGRRAWVALLVVACALCQGPVLAASEVADAVMHQDAGRVQALLAKSADVNAAQADGTTARHWAAYHADPLTAKKLLAAGAKPGARTDTEMPPLALACEAGNAPLVELLLGAGADANQTLGNGETPLMMAARTGTVAVLKALL